MRFVSTAVSAAALLSLLGGCASQEDVRLLRRPALPPTSVTLAERGEPLYKAVAVYEVLGAPEFRLFDGSDFYTTRPTRGQVNAMVGRWLDEGAMRAPDIRHARYLLTVRFETLRGPNVVWFTDKNASASVQYTLADARTGEIVFDRTYDAAFQARMPGVTEEMARAAIANGLGGALVGGLVNDDHEEGDAQIAMGAVGQIAGVSGAMIGALHDTMMWPWEDRNLATDGSWLTGPRAVDGLGRGTAFGAVGAGWAEASPGQLSDLEAGALTGAVGAASGFFGAAPIGLPAERTDDPTTIGAFDGSRRRWQAVEGMMLQNFNRFLLGLGDAQMVWIRRAVPCTELNPHADGRPREPDDHHYGVAIRVSSRDTVGYDCGDADRRRHPRRAVWPFR